MKDPPAPFVFPGECIPCGHWMWGGGWLQRIGFHDFAALQDVE